MTIQEAIDRVDLLRPNATERSHKIKWLSELDGLITREILSQHAPEIWRLEVTGGESADWEETKELIPERVIAGLDPRLIITGNSTTYTIHLNGRKQTTAVPAVKAYARAEEAFRYGYAEDGDFTISAVDDADFTGYTDDTAQDTELLAPYPYDEIYVHYINRQIDLQNQELDKYNNDTSLFNNAYDTLGDFWTRTHMPKQRSRELRI